MTAQSLDPFGYWPEQRSRIRPLGGKGRSTDQNYVFHTPYADVPAGPAFAEVSFEGLAADAGMLAVRIFQHRPAGTPATTEQGKTTALLPSIAKTGRSIKVPFQALADARYAVTGYVFGECEAQAGAVRITVQPRPTEIDDPTKARSIFGRLKARHTASLADRHAPSLEWPVSQGFTIEQTREPAFAEFDEHLPRSASSAERWESAYILSVLEHYGRLQEGARGLALSRATDPAATIAARAGCAIRSVVLSPEESIADACARELPGAKGAGFDFIWARSDVLSAAGSTPALGMIDELFESLRPAGLLIQMFRTGGETDRNAINRIILGVAAAGHIAAQVRHGDSDVTANPFGIIVRKSTEDVMA